MKIKSHILVYVFLSVVIMFLAMPKQRFIKVAETDNIVQIRLLQSTILDRHQTLQLSKQDNTYTLKVNAKNKLDYYKALTYLAETEGINKDVKLNVDIKKSKNYDKHIKHLTKQLYYIISNINGVLEHDIKLHQNEENKYDKVIINIATNKNFDSNKIERTIKNIFLTSIPEFDENSVEINIQYD